MTDDPALRYAEEFARLSQDLHRGDRPSTMERIVEAAVESIEPCDWCTVTVWHADGRMDIAASTEPLASRADQLQCELGEGPCLTFGRSGETTWRMGLFAVENVAEDTRWPAWAPQAAALGIGSVLSVRIDTSGSQDRAVLNLYSAAASSFDHGDLAVATIFARHASSALEGARQQDQLRAAAQSRLVIGVAEGILMQRFGLTLDQSFELLRRYSQTHNVKLRTLAENLVAAGGIQERGDLDAEAALHLSLGLDPDALRLRSEPAEVSFAHGEKHRENAASTGTGLAGTDRNPDRSPG
ncbi:GAF and ANTAR domain-containing protein [Microlunatus sp. Gsoil 973]|uniref:GAF and ANTAR domain-containing protein n=1 Tax=Microlunatus sp. Gsoil 973 TaxID=2672569 RepID=UPI0012B48EB3|nr:GAF and ANTAR domain-containing protein [Microlunatus sp. Gsoil 973]QGN33041.1 ANTAR domain-containing protein [Microlunatus sp. Gsoil 973]